MTDNRRQTCIDCGGACCWTSYRCQQCSRYEIAAFRKVTDGYRNNDPMSGPVRQSMIARYARQRAERIEFIDEQLSYGFSAAMIADDLGVTASTISRAMYRAGRPDLGRRFSDRTRTRRASRHFSRGYTCTRCGARRSDNSETWCRKCWDSIGAAA